MKQMGQADAQRVWQRVSTPPTTPGLSERETMLQLHRQLLCDRGFFRKYALGRSPAEQVLLRQLEQAYAEEAACIKGIVALTAGAAVKDPVNLSPTASLKHCYRNALARLTAYSLRTADPLCAPAFRQLEHQTREHCVTLLKLMGMASNGHRT